METITIERHSEKHYTIRGKSIFGEEIAEYICSGYLNQEELYDKVKRKEATELYVLVKVSNNESDWELHRRLREEVFRRAQSLMANTPPTHPMVDYSEAIARRRNY